MTVRERIAEIQREMLGDILPARARECLIQLSALYGNCLQEAREADVGYSHALLEHLNAGETAVAARIRAETTPEYLRKREAHDTTKLALEMIRSFKAVLRNLAEEYREG